MRATSDSKEVSVYNYIEKYISMHDFSPSLKEITTKIDTGERSIDSILDSLEKQGRLIRIKNVARGISLVGWKGAT
jgi:SOS-response transcriptional repressor LexA